MDEIEICEPNDQWRADFISESSRILGHLSTPIRDIQHIGSTAVLGLAAKPVIDILLAVDDPVESHGRLASDLEKLGYVNVAHDEDALRLFFRKGDPRTHHVHVVEYRSWTYWNHLLFRDYLIEHASAAEQYECLKLVMASRHRNDRDAYVKGKDPFIQLVLERAVRERLILLDD